MWRIAEPKVTAESKGTAESKVASQPAAPDQPKFGGSKIAESRAGESKINPQKPLGVYADGGAQGGGVATEQATIGATTTLKGELSGAQALFVDGRVEGNISFPNHRVTVGRGAVVLGKIEAKEVVIAGTVTGDIYCGERVDIRREAALHGDVVAQRISIDEGALVKGNVEVRRFRQGEHAEFSKSKAELSPAAPVSTISAEAPKVAAAAAFGSGQVSRVAGSSVLFEESKPGR
jgi:cytoskeletal protein CcmA (bactofilin family)